MRKREKRIRTEKSRRGTDRAGTGWAAKRAGKMANRKQKISMRTIRKRMRARGH